MESLPFVTRIPDQSIITSDTGKQGDHLLATRDQEGTYAMVYSPTGGAFSLNTSWMTGSKGKAWWFNPRDGKANAIGDVPRNAEQKYSPPTQGEGQDWVLVIADSNLAFPAEEH
ncbi:putative collagen-binding domain-containing protein [Neorhodopirellula lusitana]|uniref:putative collagen-binding domain-containing protein n=1 Tax=Neorhodopirellula lusitana TaxID=445327 RepID=UPI00384F5E29